MKINFSILAILILGLILRVIGINWDQGFHLHPDERMLLIVADRVHFFDQLNPNFFNYGSLPIYFLKGSAQLIDFIFNLNIANYQEMLYLGRCLSIIFDLLTIFLIYKICFLIFSNNKNQKTTIAFFSTFFYAIAFFPIQNSHFFISDVFLNFFITLLFYFLLKILKFYLGSDRLKKRTFDFFILGFNLALITTTKFTGIIFYPFIILFVSVLVSKFFQGNFLNKFINFLFLIVIFNFSFLIFNFLFMPYAFLNSQKFLADIFLQLKMNNNPYVFPYTLQYVDTIPYLYQIKNIFLWGLGPFISLLAFIGLILFLKEILNNKNNKDKTSFSIFNRYLLFFLFYFFYFLIIGKSAVKFMRYMLPIYPFLTIMAGYAISKIKNLKLKVKSYNLKLKIINFKFFTFLFIIGAFFWTILFINIYLQPHTRLTATEWILKNIPTGSNLAIEHWDDRLPLYGGEKYNFVELTLYDLPDDKNKWKLLNEKLNLADYIIIASNRLYVPLQKLKDCQKYKVCYPKTADYYQKLFEGKLGFKKVAEFIVYPKISIFNFQFLINDQSADESFTVYDHPKIMIFKKDI